MSAVTAVSIQRVSDASAINDALAAMGAEVFDLPASPPRVLAAIQAARSRK